VTRSGSVSEASEGDLLDSFTDDADDVLSLHRRRFSSATAAHSTDTTLDRSVSFTAPDRTLSFDLDSESSNATVWRGSATLPSHVKHLVTALESRYTTTSASAVNTKTHPPPALQSTPKITAIRDTLLSRVQDPGLPAKIWSSPGLENAPRVTAVRDGLIARVQRSVPETPKASSPPLLQSSAKITALRETLISRVQDPGSSHWEREKDLVECPSIATRQTALMDAVGRKQSTVAATFDVTVTTKTSSLPRNIEFNGSSDLTPAGLTNGRDGPPATEREYTEA